MTTCPSRDTRRMRALAAMARLKGEALVEEEAFLAVLKGLIQQELTCQLTLTERIALSAELAHIEDHYSSTAGLGTIPFVKKLTAPWHIYELPIAGTFEDSLLMKIRSMDARSRRIK